MRCRRTVKLARAGNLARAARAGNLARAARAGNLARAARAGNLTRAALAVRVSSTYAAPTQAVRSAPVAPAAEVLAVVPASGVTPAAEPRSVAAGSDSLATACTFARQLARTLAASLAAAAISRVGLSTLQRTWHRATNPNGRSRAVIRLAHREPAPPSATGDTERLHSIRSRASRDVSARFDEPGPFAERRQLNGTGEPPKRTKVSSANVIPLVLAACLSRKDRPKPANTVARPRTESSEFKAQNRRDRSPIKSTFCQPSALMIGPKVPAFNGVGQSVPVGGAREQAQHVQLALAVHGLERHDEAGSVVEHAVNSQWQRLACDDERGPVTNVAVPERAGALGLPAQACVRARAVANGDLVETVLDVEPAHRGPACFRGGRATQDSSWQPTRRRI